MSKITLPAVLLSPLEFVKVTMTRVRIFRFRFRIRKLFFDSFTLSLTLPLAGDVNRFRASVTRLFAETRTLSALLKTASPVRFAPAPKVNVNTRFRPTRIEDFESAKLALAGGVGAVPGPGPVAGGV